MFNYGCIDVTYTVVYGKLYSGEGDYSFELNKKESKAYTKARMLGKDLEDTINLCRCEREIIRYEKEEHDEDISNLEVHITFCDEGEQPPVEDVKAYLTDLLKAHNYKLAYEVVLAQINVFKDTENDWIKVALDLAMELHCLGYIKKYKDVVPVLDSKKIILKPISEKLKDALDNSYSYRNKILEVLKSYDWCDGIHHYSEGFYYFVSKVINGKKHYGVLGHTGELLLPCKYVFLAGTFFHKQDISNTGAFIILNDIFAIKEKDEDFIGLIKFDETVVLKPIFKYLGYGPHEYDSNRNLIVAGNNENFKGVFSLELNKFIIPCKYEKIWFALDSHILCEYNINTVEPWKRDCDFYNFDGNLFKQELKH